MCSKLNLMILMVLHVFAQSHNSLFSPRPYRMARLSTVASCTPEDDHRWHSLGSAPVYRTGLLRRAEEDSAAERQTKTTKDM